MQCPQRLCRGVLLSQVDPVRLRPVFHPVGLVSLGGTLEISVYLTTP